MFHFHLCLYNSCFCNIAGGVAVSATVFTLENSCPYTVWPGILSGNANTLGEGGFPLTPGASVELNAPPGWSGRFWARTGCNFDSSGHGTCVTLYLPVAVRGATPGAGSRLVMKVRADANATQVRASISLTGGGPSVPLAADPPALSPDALTTFILPPGIVPGQYRLQIRARDDKALQQMTTLNARIVVP